MATKRCTKCGLVKDLDKFYTEKSHQDGYKNACKKCIIEQQNNRCNVCGKRFTVEYPPTTDHIIPLSRGGGLTFENVQALCKSCNSKKQTKIDPQFIQTWL